VDFYFIASFRVKGTSKVFSIPLPLLSHCYNEGKFENLLGCLSEPKVELFYEEKNWRRKVL
jgi:hypothetical protein